MSDLIYVFDKKQIENKGIADAETFVKNAFKGLFSKQLEPVNGVINSDVFNTIWANQSLRKSIWNDMPTNPDDDDKNTYRGKFTLIVADINNPFYSFIKVK